MKIGVIGGSGLYEVEGIHKVHEHQVQTPFGSPSDRLVCGTIGDAELVFLPRHGRGHVYLPSEINHRANIFALKQMGVDMIVSMSAVGSFREDLVPGDILLVDQFVDRTKRSADHTFFGNGIAAHVGFAKPTCSQLRAALHDGLKGLLAADNPNGVSVHNGGTYLNMEGPAFSTLAESLLYKSWGMDVIGMTNLAEAKLAREAETCYQSIAFITDYDCWHDSHESVTFEMILNTLRQNSAMGKRIIREVLPKLPLAEDCECRHALATGIGTAPECVGPELREQLRPIIGKYLE